MNLNKEYLIRIGTDDHKAIKEAAQKVGLKMSAFSRRVLIREARKINSSPEHAAEIRNSWALY